MPEIEIFCKKCGAFVWHDLMPDGTAKCLGCGDKIDINDPKVIAAERARRGKSEKRV